MLFSMQENYDSISLWLHLQWTHCFRKSFTAYCPHWICLLFLKYRRNVNSRIYCVRSYRFLPNARRRWNLFARVPCRFSKLICTENEVISWPIEMHVKCIFAVIWYEPSTSRVDIDGDHIWNLVTSSSQRIRLPTFRSRIFSWHSFSRKRCNVSIPLWNVRRSSGEANFKMCANTFFSQLESARQHSSHEIFN